MLLAVIAAAVWYVVLRSPATTPTSVINSAGNTNRPSSAEPPTPIINAPIIQAADVDRDGLTDEAEVDLGTDPASSDTDEDGLSDQAEVDVYKTNPLVDDSDGDGRRDGEEVKAGDNPNGSGALLDLPTAINALNTPTANTSPGQ